MKRKFTKDDHAVIIKLHFGELRNNGQVVNSISNIAKRLNLGYDTVSKIVERFKLRGRIEKYSLLKRFKTFP